jgi:hypothetical protein
MLLFGRFQKVLLSSHIRVVDNDPEVHGWHGQRRQTSFSDNAPKEPYCVFEICVCRRPPLAHSLLWVYPVIMRLQLDVSAGELVDRITILELKLKLLPQMYRMELQVTLDRARHVLEQAMQPSQRLLELTDALRAVNSQLWDTEEELRSCERRSDFGEHFVQQARTVYVANDRRAALKSEIDSLGGFGVRELKSYALPE